jgi:hypothetical protein
MLIDTKGSKVIIATLIIGFVHTQIYSANAILPSNESGYSSVIRVEPSPMPGTSPTPSPANLEKSVIRIPFQSIVQNIELGYINKGVGTPGLLEGPRNLVSNTGGYAQIIPNLTTMIRNNLPTVAIVLQGLLALGATA